MSRRSRAREIVLQILYQEDLNRDTPESARQRFIAGRLKGDQHLIDFANSLLDGVRIHRDELDQHLAKTAENWKLQRMAATDRNVLRLGAYEILFAETPDRVAINEAIDLAKRYGTHNSAQFVNGVLDRLIKAKSGEAEKPGDADEATEDEPESETKSPAS